MSTDTRSNIASSLRNLKHQVVDEMKDDFHSSNIARNVSDAIHSGADALQSNAHAAVNTVSDAIHSGANAVHSGANLVQSGVNTAADIVSSGASAITSGASNVASNVVNTAANVLSTGANATVDALNTGVNVTGNIVNNITSGLSSILPHNQNYQDNHSSSLSTSNTLFAPSSSATTTADMSSTLFDPTMLSLSANTVNHVNGMKVFPLIHSHDGVECEVSKHNRQVLEKRQRDLQEAEAKSLRIEETCQKLIQDADTKYKSKLAKAQELLQASTPQLEDIAPIETRMRQLVDKLNRLQAIPAPDVRHREQELFRIRSELESLPSDNLTELKKQTEQVLQAKLRDLDAREKALRMTPAPSIEIDIKAGLASLEQSRKRLQQEHMNNLRVIEDAAKSTMEDARKHNMMIDAKLRKMNTTLSAQAQQVMDLENQYIAIQEKLIKMKNSNPLLSSTSMPASLSNAFNRVQRLAELRNSWDTTQEARELHELENRLRLARFAMDEDVRKYQHELKEAKRLSDHKLQNTKISVDLDIPVTRTVMQQGYATQKDTVLMPVEVNRLVPVVTPVEYHSFEKKRAELGKVTDAPFRPGHLEPREFKSSEFIAPAGPARVEVPQLRIEAPQVVEPQCVDIAFERTVYQDKQIQVPHKVIKPTIVIERTEEVIPIERVVTERQVIPVSLPAVHVDAFRAETQLPTQVRETVTTTTSSHNHHQHPEQTSSYTNTYYLPPGATPLTASLQHQQHHQQQVNTSNNNSGGGVLGTIKSWFS